MFSNTRLALLFLLASAFVFFISCSDDDDNPVNNSTSPHLEAVGAMLIYDTDTLVTVNGTSVEGELEVHEGDTLGPINVLFLHPDGYWYDPSELSSENETSHLLVVDEYDADITNAIIGTALSGNNDPWAFGVVGVEAGETTARVKIFHIDHPDYVSPLIDIHVEHAHEHSSAVGCKLVMNDSTYVTVDGTTITGELHVHEGHSPTVTVWFLDPDGDWFQPHADDGFLLDVTVDDTGVLSAVVDTENPWNFTATGVEEGETSLTTAIIHGNHADYTSPAIPVHVEHHTVTAVGCKLTLDGVDVVTVNGSAITGSLELTSGETTALITVSFLDPDGDWIQPDDEDYTAGLTVTGSNFTVQSDAGDRYQFTASGTEAGSGQLQIELFHVDHAHYTSPQIPVNTTAGD